jgi:D-glycero-alpha-D-manno-heptose-7-phosphate kinase
VSNGRIDGWYDCARAHGATGGKITGAGGGGFLLLYAPPERHWEILRALPELRRVGFGLEPQGSKILYVEEESDALAIRDGDMPTAGTLTAGGLAVL